MKNIMLENDPIFPLLMMIHESKKFHNHNEFLFLIENLLDISNYENVIIITDRENSIIQAINKTKLNHFFCTIHIKNDLKFWLNKHNIEKGLKNKIKSSVHLLINSKSIQKYEDILKRFEDENNESKDEKTYEYLKNQILPNIKRNIENDKRGIFQNVNPTNNMSESYNYVLKQATDWKENSVDKMCLIFYYLQSFNIREISRANRGIGNYRCKNIGKRIKINEQQHVFDYEKIVEKIKDDFKFEFNDTNFSESKSLEILAKQALDKNLVSHNSHLGCFTIRDFTNPMKCYIVFLKPKTTCTCGSKIECFHILCAKLSINDKTELKSLNISEMVKKKVSKKSKNKDDNDEVKFIEFKKNEDKKYKLCLKNLVEETNKIKVLNPNEKIDKIRNVDSLLNFFDWDTYKYAKYHIN